MPCGVSASAQGRKRASISSRERIFRMKNTPFDKEQTVLLRSEYSIWCVLSRKMTNSTFRIVFYVLFSFCPFRFPVLTRAEGYGTLFLVETLWLWRKRVVFEGGFPV
jgi:hypothetical protein